MSKPKVSPRTRVKRQLAQLARDHVRLAFNTAIAYSAAVMPKSKTATFCKDFVQAFQKELDRMPTHDGGHR